MADEINITVIEQPIEVAIAITDSPVAVNIATVQGIEEAPVNGTTYGRKDAAWQAVVTSVAWGGITGTLSNQTDLQSALNAKQPGDPTLTSIAALGSAADKMIYTTGVDTWAEATLTAFARTILDDANAAAVRATIGAGTGSGDLLAANNLSDLSNIATARTNLGLGAIALEASPLAASKGGTGIANVGTLTNASNTTITDGGTIALGGFTLTVPATGTAALLATANVFTVSQTVTVDDATITLINPTAEDVANGRDTYVKFWGKRLNGTLFQSGQIVVLRPSFEANDGRADMAFSVSNDAGALIERMRILQDGQIYFGSTAGGSTMTIVSGSNNYRTYFFMRNTDGGSFEIGPAAAQPMIFQTGNGAIESFRADGSGNVGIGTGETVSARLHLVKNATATSAIAEAGRIEARVSTAATGGAAGFGTGLSWYAETATDGTNQQQGLISTSWIDATNASRKAKISLSAYDTAARLGIEIEASGSAAKLGFFGVATVVRPTALTTQLTTITHTAPTPDYAIQNLTNVSGYGFVTQDEGNTVLSVISNLQTRVGELETKLQALGLLT